MDYLDKAIDAGFVTLQYFETDTDLDGLRKEKRFKEILEVVKKGGRAEPQEDKKQEKEDKKDKKKAALDKAMQGKMESRFRDTIRRKN